MAKNYRLLDEILEDLRHIDKHGWSIDGTWTWDQTAWGRRMDSQGGYVVGELAYKTKAGLSGLSLEDMPNQCGTALCVAGAAVTKRDYNLVFHRPDTSSEQCKHIVTGQTRQVSDAARELLGLTEGEADELFNGSNDLQRIESLIHDWKTQDGLVKRKCVTCGQDLPSDWDSQDCHVEVGARF